jgi:mannose-6-phosphate isomerase-like protein (cupin superfamily)
MAVTAAYPYQTLCKVNESVIRLGVMQGEYHWHKHDNDDEFFFVLSGRFTIDLEGRSIELRARDIPGNSIVLTPVSLVS